MNALSRCRRTPAVAALLLLLSTGAFAQGGAPKPAAAPAAAATAVPDIRDIRGPKAVASPWLIPMISLTALFAAGGSYAAWAWNRRRRRDAPRLPHEIALARLDMTRALLAPAHVREFSIDVSDIVREYIESRFEVRAAHLTTDEFLRTVTTSSDRLLAANRALLDEFLQACDLAKFGGWNLSAEEMERLLQGARRFVVESRPAAVVTPDIVSRSPASGESYASLPST